MVGYEVKVEGYDKLKRALSPEKARLAMTRILENTARVLASEVSALSPARTGRLMKSWTYRQEGPLRYVVGTGVPYAPYVEFGTRPHVILPRRARALRFFAEGGVSVIFARRVKHPGTEPRRFVRQGILLVRGRFKSFAINIIRGVIKSE